MTVSELISFLQTQPQNLTVIYQCCSEWNTLEAEQIKIETHCEPRPDGWIQHSRKDKRTRGYLVFPGN